MITSVSDPLFTASAEGEIAPILVEDYEANDDYTEWTFNIREGISFHDGTPLDGAAVEFNMESCQYSSLTGAAFLWIKDISSSGQTVTITTNQPYVAAPRQFTERQCAYMFSPEWLKTLEDIPQRTETLPIYDAELAAEPATGEPAAPVGLGAFVFESYSRERQLVQADAQRRLLAGPERHHRREPAVPRLRRGRRGRRHRQPLERCPLGPVRHHPHVERRQHQAVHGDDELETCHSLYGDTDYTMLNVAEGDDPKGVNAASPLLNVHCRRALAHATDLERLSGRSALRG